MGFVVSGHQRRGWTVILSCQTLVDQSFDVVVQPARGGIPKRAPDCRPRGCQLSGGRVDPGREVRYREMAVVYVSGHKPRIKDIPLCW